MKDPHHPQRARAIVMLLLANLFWALSFPIVKALLLIHGSLLPEAGAWFSAIYTVAPRFLLAVTIFIVLRPREFWRLNRSELKQGMGLGLFTAGGMLLQNDALQFTSASTSAFLTQIYAILIPAWVAVRTRHMPGAWVWMCGALVLAGVALLGNFDPFDLLRAGWRGRWFGRGEWETLLSSLFFMGQILWLGKKEFTGNRAEKITFAMFATEALVFWPLAIAVAPDAHALLAPWTSLPWVGLTVILTVCCTLGSFSLMNAWQPKITTTEAGLIYCIEPVFASAMALFMPAWFSAWAQIDYANERATWTLLVGGGLITLANVLIQLKPPEET